MNVSTLIPPTAARALLLALAALWLSQMVAAQPKPEGSAARTPASVASSESPALDTVGWLQRMHAASRQRTYVGTFVVSASTGNLSSARIWHVWEGDLQMERIEALSGPRRSTFRRNEHVMTFLPELKVVKSERRENLDLFPNLMGAPDASIGDFYGARILGQGRVAGFDADVVQLVPRDKRRFGYRVWSERESGLAIKLQTLNTEGRVVEQSAFSELQLDAPIKAHAIKKMMTNTAGYRIEKSELERTTAEEEGWALKAPVAGFKPVSCYRRPMADATNAKTRTVQWTFSDGLASVSIFIEPHDAQGPSPQEGALALGATHTISRRLVARNGEWWLTAVGEVPPETLEAFAENLIRTR